MSGPNGPMMSSVLLQLSGVVHTAPLYLWLVSRTRHAYDEYDAFICCASSPQQARLIHPHGDHGYDWNGEEWGCTGSSSWPDWPEDLRVTFAGMAAPDIAAGTVLLASFNAG